MLGTIYLLHFERPISRKHTCQHYLGWALDLAARIAEHRNGRGARLTQVALERGIAFEVVRTWPGDRAFERKLKHRKESPRLCPLCCPTLRTRPTGAVQFELPQVFDFPPLPNLPRDWYEISYYQRLWRPRAATGADWDDGLL
jgi:hypothetical protein